MKKIEIIIKMNSIIIKFLKEQENLFIDNNHYLAHLGYHKKNITRDGNCYYRCLSYIFKFMKEPQNEEETIEYLYICK